jgi:hypothetical protein
MASISGQAIASDAVNDVGHAYLLGGAPGPNFDQPWDCSSAVAKWLGHDFGLRLPGQSKPGYDGTSHGPGSWQYISWNGAKTVSGPSAGCLVIWPGMGAAGHIGIAISATKMVSALNPAMGTQVTDIVTTKPGFHIYREITDAGNPNMAGCLPGLLIYLIGLRMAKKGSSGSHRTKKGKIRQFGRNASQRKEAEREKQKKIAEQRKKQNETLLVAIRTSPKMVEEEQKWTMNSSSTYQSVTTRAAAISNYVKARR